ncbi:MAG TPA: hypothetical protein VFD95_07930, partial [Usitatibacter sp.]|nr:hypothetical protein [Usitatibacter sp.]
LQKAKDGMKDRASATTPHQRARGSSTTGASTVTLTIPSFVQDKKKLTIVAGGLGLVVLVLGIMVAMKRPSPVPAGEIVAAATPTTATSAPAVPPKDPVVPAKAAASEPAKPAEPAKPVTAPGEPPKPIELKPDTKVLAPAPTQVPPPAPTSEAKAADAKKASDAVKAEGAKAVQDSKSDPTKLAAAGTATTPGIIPATVFLNVAPWGEVFVNGKSQGVSPPRKFIKLDPGKYRIEIKNTTFPAHVENLDLKTRDEITLRHRFQW